MKNILSILILYLLSNNLHAVNIAITIDDYPMPSSRLFSFEKRTDLLIQACKQSNCKVAFFCIGAEIKKQKQALYYLDLLDKQSHFLCNHSMTHSFLSSQPLQSLKQEVIDTEKILKPYKHMKKWFRYPYLDYSDLAQRGGSLEKATEAQKMLRALGYTEGYVTINTFDFHINARLQQALKRGDTIDYAALKKVYLDLLKQWCLYYIQYYTAAGYNNITHTLLLHANDLNALYLSDILDMLHTSGWNIVSPELAFCNTAWRTNITDILTWRDSRPPTMHYKAIDTRLQKVFSKPS